MEITTLVLLHIHVVVIHSHTLAVDVFCFLYYVSTVVDVAARLCPIFASDGISFPFEGLFDATRCLGGF